MSSTKKGISRPSQQLQETRARVASRRGAFKVTPSTAVIDPEYHVRAHEVVYESMNATKLGHIKIDPKLAAVLLLEKDGTRKAQAMEAIRVVMAGRPFAIYADRIIYLEAEGELRRRAAEMVIDRVNPLPNRVDSAKKSRYKILRYDPNRKEAVMEELPATSSTPASAPDEPL
jgi:hypothetical protein